MSTRTDARELILKVLFQIDVGKLPLDEALATSFESVRPPEEERAYVDEIVRGVAACEGKLDNIIADLAEGWKLDRLAKVDKNVLRTALYELIHRRDILATEVVHDAIETAKKYSTEDSGRFVNGILASFLRNRDTLGSAQDEVEVGAR
jgi:transcription antitermination protein NusB